ncbi:ATP-dependent DNA helicase, rep family protein [Halogeometricum borinquense DSM 11551]|uniref:DNA 3'-5' helicase n=1 Tax=Halogeometricum borinquense (strain ATCC 700274 / DSM 11551 / JCM 10706 / KCTC 4070 / PR3) TaxID=469382 RepID=E4NL72_HALBP|nr:ATP-dependent helicase [Halogeometricum borinquense]ADQ68321.1 ATP-dependent DNA helicase, Rep family [Halogeometricum borinquense DSM 11551]ELY24638.1 ATP-dependent DNA helicase, rep family protein [Halogeometricum borinquense DSM 11551]
MSDSDAKVTRLFGGPGSGKTTALLDRVEEMLEDDDVTIRDILVVSYTRAAAAEIRERLAERLDISPRALQGNVATMHAKAYELLDLSRNDVVGEKDKKEFCEEYGVEFEDEYGGAGRRTARSTTIGNKIIATSQWLQRTRRDVADWYDVPFNWNVEEVRLPPEIDPNAQEGNKYTPTWPSDDDRIDVPGVIRGWRKYKGDNGLVGFADMLERVRQRSLVPNVDYLVIDEFQDITTLQYDVYQEWLPHLEGVLIAGDDDQVVYAWQGADPNLLLDAERDEDVVLPNSYRLPSRILDVVNEEIRHIDKRQEKDLHPRKEGGVVEGVASPSMLDLARNVRYTIEEDEDDESIMVLFRARYQMFQFIDEFLPLGIPFSVLTDQRMWTDRLTEYVEAIEKLEREENINGLEARRLADMLQESAFGSNERDDLFDYIDELQEETGVEDLTDLEVELDVITDHAPFVPDGAAAGDMVRKVTSFQRKSVEAYFAGEYQGMDPNRVRVGTIHSAKGREADHVFVSTDLTEKVVEQMAASVDDEEVSGVEEFTTSTDPVPILTDNERRVFYVGMSRARERLVILENLIKGAPTLPVSVLLHNEVRDTPVEELLEEAQTGDAPAPEP